MAHYTFYSISPLPLKYDAEKNKGPLTVLQWSDLYCATHSEMKSLSLWHHVDTPIKTNVNELLSQSVSHRVSVSLKHKYKFGKRSQMFIQNCPV